MAAHLLLSRSLFSLALTLALTSAAIAGLPVSPPASPREDAAAGRSESRPATQPIDFGPPAKPLPYRVTRLAREGPLTGVVLKLDLTDPRVHVQMRLADDRDPDGDGPALGRLDTVVNAAVKNDFEIAINASFFALAGNRVTQGKKVGYFVGNGAWPVGWLMCDGRLVHKPPANGLRTAIVVHEDGRATIEPDCAALPPDAKQAVSGSSQILTRGEITPPAKDELLHPRTAVGVSADGKTLVLLVIDGRRPTISRGATQAETASLLKEFGAADGINLDGGGSAVMVVKDTITGVHAILNRPSEVNALVPAVESVQRPVVDVIGVQIDEE